MRKTSKTISTKNPGDQSKLRGQWVTEILKVHGKTAEAIIELGQTLNKAKAALDKHGQWQIVFKQNELPFSLSLAERYMKIARDRKLTKSASVQILPNAVSTLYQLSKLSDSEFKQHVADGSINPRTTRKQATAFIAEDSRAEATPKPARNVPSRMLLVFETSIKELKEAIRCGDIKSDDVEFKSKIEKLAKELLALFS